MVDELSTGKPSAATVAAKRNRFILLFSPEIAKGPEPISLRIRPARKNTGLIPEELSAAGRQGIAPRDFFPIAPIAATT
ncbi:MAG: hypothetical protein IKE66_16315 [Hyphomicrobium sp.]|nr:hypothetical protein [Hyphomicrobium sp.]